VTGSTKTGLITHNCRFDFFFFFKNSKLYEHTIKFHNPSHSGLSGLLLLAAFPKPTGNPTSGLGL